MKRVHWVVLVGVLLVGTGAWFALDTVAPPPRSDVVSDLPAIEEPDVGEGALEAAPPTLERTAPEPGPTEPRPAPTEATEGPGVRFTGLVVDADDQAVAGAEVSVKVLGEVKVVATSDPEGRYRFQLDLADPGHAVAGLVIVRGPKNTVGVTVFWLFSRSYTWQAGPGEARTLSKITLRPALALPLHVNSDCATALPATVWVVDGGFGASEPFAVAQTDAAGDLVVEGLPPGLWRVIAAAAGCGRVTGMAKLPRPDADPLELTLPAERTLTIRVREKGSERPIAGALIAVAERIRLASGSTYGPLVSHPRELETDETGIAVLRGLGDTGSLELRATAAGYPTPSRRVTRRGVGAVTVEADVSEVTIELSRPITVRWAIKNEGAGVPPDGSPVQVRPWTNTGRLEVPPTGTIEKGEVVIPGWGQDGASGYATVEGFGMARLTAQAGHEEGYPTAFYPSRKIEVFIKHADGTPAKGYHLLVVDGGNNPVAPSVPLDEEGRAVMAKLYGGPRSLVNVSVSDVLARWGGRRFPLGSVDLKKEDGRFEFVLPAEHQIRVRLTIEGKRLSDALKATPLISYQPKAFEREGDILIVTWQPAKAKGKLNVSAVVEGHLATPKQVDYDTAQPLEVTIDLRAAGSAKVQVKLPEDKRHKIYLQHWNKARADWTGAFITGGAPVFGGGRRADANGVVPFPKLTPGTYRAVDEYSGSTSEPFEVMAGQAAAETTLDLSRCGWVKGRVEAPAGVALSGFSVGTTNRTPSRSMGMGGISTPGRAVNGKDGAFWARVPGDRPVTIRLFHPTCRPHPTEGQLTLTAPREGVVLRALQGSTATLRFAQAPVIRRNPGRPRSLRVRLYKDEVKGKGIELVGLLDAEARTLVFGGYAPGTYTVWVDAPNSRPVVLSGVTLGDTDSDLGEVKLVAGSLLRIHVKVKEGQSHPRYSVWLNKLDDPTYSRSTDVAGPVMTVRGLGPGRFRVSANAYNGAAAGLSEEIEFDGETAVERTIDLR